MILMGMAIICRPGYNLTPVLKKKENTMGRRAWISISGLIWAMAGFMLLSKGLRILTALPDQTASTWWIGGGLLVGFFKGRFVLSKTVHRISTRIASLPTPIHFLEVYPKSYWILLSTMMGMGLLMRMVPANIHGFIDLAVGSALINGAVLYFRCAKAVTQ